MVLSEIPDTGLRELLLWIFRRRKMFRVTGNSMRPLFAPGDMIVMEPAAGGSREYAVGDIVVAPHPNREGVKMIKRVARVGEDGRLDLRGDNPSESTNYLNVPAVVILGRVTSKFP